jgi:serine/threonine-protein kinase
VGNEVYMVMELVDGQPLSRLISKSGLSAKDVVHYGIQIADALVHAHAHGVIHRDLKSLNIIIRRDGLVKVLDFGLSARVGNDAIDAVTRSLCLQNDCCVVVGTIPYLAPEALKGQRPDARSDIWSFGVLLYESVTGQLPFQGETVSSLSAAILHQSPPPLPPRAPSKLRDVVERCLSKDANQRYQRFDEVAEQMRMIEQLA